MPHYVLRLLTSSYFIWVFSLSGRTHAINRNRTNIRIRIRTQYQHSHSHSQSHEPPHAATKPHNRTFPFLSHFSPSDLIFLSISVFLSFYLSCLSRLLFFLSVCLHPIQHLASISTSHTPSNTCTFCSTPCTYVPPCTALYHPASAPSPAHRQCTYIQ
ncbi:hypothetical protein DFH11DRAFT_578023 [Phellopilus nigrolimitatus]|nr:hypothetical protein DFH11DRAFT_578023 [Phellopilus nigrolimitatus]